MHSSLKKAILIFWMMYYKQIEYVKWDVLVASCSNVLRAQRVLNFLFQLAFTSSKLTIETQEQGVKSVQS